MAKYDTQLNRYMNEQLGTCTIVFLEEDEGGFNALYKNSEDHYIVCANKTRQLIDKHVLPNIEMYESILNYSIKKDRVYNDVEKINIHMMKQLGKENLFPEYITSCDKYYLYKCKKITTGWKRWNTAANGIDMLREELSIDSTVTKVKYIEQQLKDISKDIDVSSLGVDVPRDWKKINLTKCLCEIKPELIYTDGENYEWFNMHSAHILHVIPNN